MSLAVALIQGFEVEVELAQVFGFEARHLQFDRQQAIEAAVKKQQIQCKVLPANLDRILRTHIAKITAKLGQEAAKMFNQPLVKVGL